MLGFNTNTLLFVSCRDLIERLFDDVLDFIVALLAHNRNVREAACVVGRNLRSTRAGFPQHILNNDREQTHNA